MMEQLDRMEETAPMAVFSTFPTIHQSAREWLDRCMTRQWNSMDAKAGAGGPSINPSIQPSTNPRREALRRGGRVVYRGGLENRFGFTADGGSNPSLSANLNHILTPTRTDR
jgi:hypothetical protein